MKIYEVTQYRGGRLEIILDGEGIEEVVERLKDIVDLSGMPYQTWLSQGEGWRYHHRGQMGFPANVTMMRYNGMSSIVFEPLESAAHRRIAQAAEALGINPKTLSLNGKSHATR
ncbi:hypothetical protein HYY71_03640 [Candidatus Woesearchaeota archaeon]|nr:hypothetical protein [Candidatus Woesearchaeota archaeon]